MLPNYPTINSLNGYHPQQESAQGVSTTPPGRNPSPPQADTPSQRWPLKWAVLECILVFNNCETVTKFTGDTLGPY